MPQMRTFVLRLLLAAQAVVAPHPLCMLPSCWCCCVRCIASSFDTHTVATQTQHALGPREKATLAMGRHQGSPPPPAPVSYTHLRAHETEADL
eukprot:2787294-Rhodomonas_salina.2